MINGEEYTAAPLVECLLVCEHGSMLITTRSINAALQLMDRIHRNDVINVQPMEDEQAVALLQKKLGEHADRNDIKDLATALELPHLQSRRRRRTVVGEGVEA